jgi:hypothetical protein
MMRTSIGVVAILSGCGAAAPATTVGTNRTTSGPGLELSVPFERGYTHSNDARDVISVESVVGDRDTIAAGGTYRIRGHYTLASSADAIMAAFATTDAGSPSSRTYSCGHTANSMKVVRGSGDYELTLCIESVGEPHVSFYPTRGGESFSTTYIRSGESANRRRP